MIACVCIYIYMFSYNTERSHLVCKLFKVTCLKLETYQVYVGPHVPRSGKGAFVSPLFPCSGYISGNEGDSYLHACPAPKLTKDCRLKKWAQ